jgi:hypothetical protein
MTSRTNERPRVWLGLVCALAVAAAPGCAHQPALIDEQPRRLAGFTALDLGPGLAGEVHAGEPFAVSVRGDARFVPYVITELQQGALVVRMSELVAVRPEQPMAVIVRLPSVDRLVVAGSRLTAAGMSGEQMTVTATAGSSVDIDGVSGQRLALSVHGRSFVRITGSVEHLQAEVFGASQLEAQRLDAARVTVAVTPDARLHLNRDRPPAQAPVSCARGQRSDQSMAAASSLIPVSLR